MRLFWSLALLLGAASSFPALAATPAAFSAYTGMCDASAAVALDDAHFAVANDEDNVIRIYPAQQPGPPLQSIQLSSFLHVDPKKPETDFEGAAWLGDRIYWITSHGRNKDAKYRESRHRFFAMQWQTNLVPPRLVPIGKPYRFLLPDMVRDPRLAAFGLAAASLRPPKSRNALNIEGLCATPEGQLLIGFRNPIPNGQALLVPLLNPEELLQGLPARFDNPILLPLDQLGVRDIVRHEKAYLIIAGAYDASGPSRLYSWSGPGTIPARIEGLDFRGLNPEAIVLYPGRSNQAQLLSDDGACQIKGVPCKMLRDLAQRQFRSIWISLPSEARTQTLP